MARSDQPNAAPKGADSPDAVARILGRGSIYTIATVIQLGAGILTIPVLTRIVDPVQYGTITAALVVQAVLANFAAFGMPAAISRTFFRRHGPLGARALVGATAVAAVVVAIIADLTGPLWSQIFDDVPYGAELRLAVVSAAAAAVLVSAQVVLQSADRVRAFVWSAAIATAGAQGLGLALAGLDGGPVAYLAGVTIGLYAALAFTWLAVGIDFAALGAGMRGGSRSLVRGALRTGLPTIPAGLALYLLSAADRVVVERLEGLASAGAYYVAYAVGSLTIFLVTALNNAWGPGIYGSADEHRWKLLADSAVAITRVVALAAAALAIGAPIALALIAPADYDLDGLGPVSALVAASALPYLWYVAAYNVIVWHGRTVILGLATPICAVVNVVLCFALIPELGVEGAALATLVTYALLALLVWVPTRSHASIPWDGPALALAATPAAAGLALALLLPVAGAWLEVRGALAVGFAVVALALVTKAGRTERRKDW